MDKIRIGVSQCLLGDRVRYDGQHKHDHFITDTLGKWVEYVPVCPEVECGLSVPREAMRLVGPVDAPRLMTQRTERDLTDQMQDWAARRVRELERESLCGFIFKARSPSSGMERVKIYNGHGGLSGHGAGLFAAAFMAHFPLLPVEEEGRLNDPALRENFIERIFTLKRYRDTVRSGGTPSALMRFHAANKFLITAHSPKACTAMGRMLAGADTQPMDAVVARYESELLQALKLIATVAKHVNVLQHIMGFFKRELAADEKQELVAVIETYRAGQIPLIVPVTLLNHYARKYDRAYLLEQTYLHPHPLELKLRNHA